MAMNGSFRTLTFDGEVSTDYGVFISGSGTFNAPERDVEMITIPGRNGNFVLDNGRFENIEVTYRAGLYGVDEENFAEKIAEFRNFLCSKKGYCRLEDDYNPDEYRLAVYKSGLEVEPELLKAGEFDIVFDCKPQRFLKSGENPRVLSNGIPPITVNNPTLFSSRPLFIVRGYGDLIINDETITVENKEIGLTDVRFTLSSTKHTAAMDVANINSGDALTISGAAIHFWFTVNAPGSGYTITDHNDTWTTGSGSVTTTSHGISLYLDDIETTYATNTLVNFQTQFTVSNQINTLVYTLALTLRIGGNQIHLESRLTKVSGTYSLVSTGYSMSIDSISAISTKTITDQIYIDLDIGEAYTMSGSTPQQINEIVSIPATPPELQAGDNIVRFNKSTMTSVILYPKWWRV